MRTLWRSHAELLALKQTLLAKIGDTPSSSSSNQDDDLLLPLDVNLLEAASRWEEQRIIDRHGTPYMYPHLAMPYAWTVWERGTAAQRETLKHSYQSQLRQFERWPPMHGPFAFPTLPMPCRPLMLAVFLGIKDNDTFVRLSFEHSDCRTRRYTYTALGPVHINEWNKNLSLIANWLGHGVCIESYGATWITLARWSPPPPASSIVLPETVPMRREWLQPDKVFLGLETTQLQPFAVPPADMTHLLVTGTPGMGKSNWLRLLLLSCLNASEQFEHIYAVCGQGVGFSRFRHRSGQLSVIDDRSEVHNLARSLVAEMKARVAELARTGRDNVTGRTLLLLIDEFGAFNTSESLDKKSEESKAHAQFMQDMSDLARRGRKAGIRLILTVQQPTEIDIAPHLRSVLPSVLSFRLPITQHATALFGELEGMTDDPRKLPRGRAIFHNGLTSERTSLLIPMLPERK